MCCSKVDAAAATLKLQSSATPEAPPAPSWPSRSTPGQILALQRCPRPTYSPPKAPTAHILPTGCAPGPLTAHQSRPWPTSGPPRCPRPTSGQPKGTRLTTSAPKVPPAHFWCTKSAAGSLLVHQKCRWLTSCTPEVPRAHFL